MNFEQTTSTSASLTQAWSALANVASFPRWTTSMTSVQPLDGADLRTGHRYRITQPAMPVLVWRVSEVHEGESFVWENRLPGVHTVAYHRVASDAGGGTRITIGIRQSGWFAGIAGVLTGRRTRRYLELEAAGLKAASESAA